MPYEQNRISFQFVAQDVLNTRHSKSRMQSIYYNETGSYLLPLRLFLRFGKSGKCDVAQFGSDEGRLRFSKNFTISVGQCGGWRHHIHLSGTMILVLEKQPHYMQALYCAKVEAEQRKNED